MSGVREIRACDYSVMTKLSWLNVVVRVRCSLGWGSEKQSDDDVVKQVRQWKTDELSTITVNDLK